jgi:hypothetical protein
MSRPTHSLRRRLDVLDDRVLPAGTLAVGCGVGGPPLVHVYDPATNMTQNFLAYDSSFTGGVHVAMADVNGDGVKDIITAPGVGGGPHIKVFDGVTGMLDRQFLAYDSAFRGGAWIAGGDVNGDGRADIITGAGLGGGPHVKVFDSVTGTVLQSFFAYDSAFRGGATVAAGDINGNGLADIVTGAGFGGGPHVKAFDGQTGAELLSFLAYDPAFRGGVFVATGRLEAGSTAADIITGPGQGGGPHVQVFNGSGALLQSFLAYDPRLTSGVRVASADIPGSLTQAIITGPGEGGGPQVLGFSAGNQEMLFHFYAFDLPFSGGVFVG